ncbi:hypothetical protein [Arenibacter latericius]|uniref:hypothetical protein n=1 Tax=Arenibacter latericius TaxID=86104 RepID=UPI00047A0E0C|nr:hypothetical protein [Arenibacter latericius]
MSNLNFYRYYLESHFDALPFIVKTTLILIVILIVLYLLSLVRIFFIAYKQRNEYQRKEKIRRKYESRIKDILYDKNNVKADQININLGIGEKGLKSWEKVQITNVLLDLIKKDEIKYS